MKTKILWALAALVLLAGCQKSGGAGKEIRFSAVTRPDASQTKTAYSGDLVGGKERINWSTTDIIRIYSTQAVCNNDDSYHWADYKPSTVTTSGVNSNAGSLTPQADRGGLAWGDASSYDFYAIYPAPADDPAATVRGTSTTPFQCAITAGQVGTATSVSAIETGASTTVYYPPMSNAHMVAYDSETKGADIDLLFEPAYTAFHIVAGAPSSEPDKVIKSVALTSASTALAGAYTAYFDGTNWTYGTTSATDMTVTFTFDSGNYTIAAGEWVEFVLFALPQVLTDLTIVFTMGDNSTRSLKLKKNTPDGTTNAAGFINFAPCKKHYIKGLLIPESIWTVNNTTPVILREMAAEDWNDETSDIAYGDSPIVNASGLDEVNLSTHSYRFSIYEPHGQTWKIKVLDSSGNVKTGVTIVRDTTIPSGSSDSASGSGELTGTIRGGDPSAPALVQFHLTGSTGGENCTLSFSVVAGGTEYSINSEVVRGSWGTGYSYINF